MASDEDPRGLASALLAVGLTAATIAAGTWLTAPENEGRQVALGEALVVRTEATPEPTPTAMPVPPPTASPVPTAEISPTEPSFDRNRYSTTDPNSLWVVVNKRRPLPPDHTPALTTVRGHQVAVAVADDLTRMLDDADARGLGLRLLSGHRSYARQRDVYARAVATRGTATADAVSARPGHSEHQTGLAVDVGTSHVPSCDLFPCFGDTTAGRWVASEAWRYGFLVRYTGTNREVTGFAHEPWHLRYVGPDLAREMRRTRAASLEEFLGVEGGDYR